LALTLDNAVNKKFVDDYKKRTTKEANVFAVQGYDTARLIVDSVNAVQGNTKDKAKWTEAIGGVSFEGPRGKFKMDPKTNNVVQSIYARDVKKVGDTLQNVVIKNFGEIADPGDDSKG